MKRNLFQPGEGGEETNNMEYYTSQLSILYKPQEKYKMDIFAEILYNVYIVISYIFHALCAM